MSTKTLFLSIRFIVSDIDECESDQHSCDQLCHNVPGSYNCFCEEGYILLSDSKTCEDINECEGDNQCTGNFRCSNTIGSYLCYCSEGFDNSDGNCADIDECDLSPDYCPDSSSCNNTIGSYWCLCKDGYIQVNENTCEDIDECDSGQNNCTDNMLCVNAPGSYRCDCKIGYTATDTDTDTADSDIFDCEDMDECVTGSHGCQGICVNTEGSFLCGCEEGLLLQNDGFSCKSKIFNMHLVNIQLKINCGATV